MPKGKTLKLFTGNANRPLAERVAAYIGQPLGDVEVGRFPGGEVKVKFREDVRGCHVVIVQPTNEPETNLKELKLMTSAARGSSAKCVTAVISYYGYGRQDRKDQPRVPISARLVADEIAAAGAHNVVLLDLHSAAITGFFPLLTCNVDHLYSRPVFVGALRHLGLTELRCGTPDVGRAKVGQSYMRRLQHGIFFAVKGDDLQRAGSTIIIGDVDGMDCLIIDDEISTGGTIRDASNALKTAGANRIYVAASHGKCVEDAPEILAACPVDRFFIGDSVRVPSGVAATLGKERLTCVTFAPLLGEAIRHIHDDESVSVLFDDALIARLYDGNYVIEPF